MTLDFLTQAKSKRDDAQTIAVVSPPVNLSEAERALQELADVFLKQQSPLISGTSFDFAEKAESKLAAEAPLLNMEAKYRALVEQIPAVVFMAYLDKGIGEAYVSPQIEAALGFSQSEWLEDPVRWYQQIHPDDKMRWSVEAAEMFLTGKPLRSSYRVMARDGRVLWFQCEAKMIRRDDGRPWFIHGVGFDITERKGLEEAILEISAKEQRRIAQDLHDGLGQHLTGIAFMSKVLQEKLSDRSLPEAVEAAKIVQMVNQAIDNTRQLARGLHPVAVEPQGLMSALKKWASEVEELFHIGCTFHCDTPLYIHDGNLATHLYRIAQEAVNNAIRHGKARNIVICLSGKIGTGILTIQDDGEGFPVNPANQPGVGLSIMNYRADMVGGSLKVHPNENRGITVTCMFPARSGE
ncbi:MAG: domain S-box protein [Candidatus Acidoferrum typicum]|nr:domain S-box protein [Candidatus Acidoferrum typicum]